MGTDKLWEDLIKQNRLVTKQEKQIMKENLILFCFTNLEPDKTVNELMQDKIIQAFLRKLGYENFEVSDLLEIINNQAKREIENQNLENHKKR